MHVARLQTGLENPLLLAALQNIFDNRQRGTVQRFQLPGTLQPLAALHVFHTDNSHVVGVSGVIAHAPFHQLHQRLDRRQVLQPQLLFRFTDPRIHMLQYRLVQLLFALEVVDHHALGGLRLDGDLLHTRAGEAIFGKHGDGGGKDALFQGLCFIMSNEGHNDSFFYGDKKYT